METPTALRRNSSRPRLRTLEATPRERHASWLELFFDLVFVLAVAQIARILTDNSDLGGLAKFAALFLPVWWSWVGFTFYADRFESEEAAYRVLMFAGMLTVAGLSLTLGDAFTPQGDAPFVVCYVLVRVVLILLYGRAAYHIPLARGFGLGFVATLSTSVLLYLSSLFFDPPVRYLIWAIGLAIEFAAPLINLQAARILPVDRSHIPERFGLFTIIVLGEAVIATATGAAQVSWNVATIVTACLGFAMAACIWWLNFEFVEDSAASSPMLRRRFLYIYGHFFMVASIVATGIGVEHAIKEATDAHLHIPTLALLTGGLGVYLGAITTIRIVTGVCNLIWIRVAGIAVLASVFFAGQFIPPVAVMLLLAFLLSSSVWLEGLYSGEEEEEESPHLVPCEHASSITVTEPRDGYACEECRKNNWKWVHLRLCLSCGHVGCCDSSIHKHATKHFHKTEHAIAATLEADEDWAWCYVDNRFVPPPEISKAA